MTLTNFRLIQERREEERYGKKERKGML